MFQFAVALLVVTLSAGVPAQDVPRDFTAFLTRMDAAQIELQNGRAEPYKALWSRSSDVTLSGGLGGAIEKGWDAVGRRLDWVATQISNGSTRLDRLVAHASGDLAYLVQAEHLKYRVPGQSQDTTRDYRVTMVFRREASGWKIVHRQADSQTVKQQKPDGFTSYFLSWAIRCSSRCRARAM